MRKLDDEYTYSAVVDNEGLVRVVLIKGITSRSNGVIYDLSNIYGSDVKTIKEEILLSSGPMGSESRTHFHSYWELPEARVHYGPPTDKPNVNYGIIEILDSKLAKEFPIKSKEYPRFF